MLACGVHAIVHIPFKRGFNCPTSKRYQRSADGASLEECTKCEKCEMGRTKGKLGDLAHAVCLPASASQGESARALLEAGGAVVAILFSGIMLGKFSSSRRVGNHGERPCRAERNSVR